MVYYCQDPLAN